MRPEIDRAALGPVPATGYLVTERHRRRLHKDALVAFEISLYSVPWWGRSPGERRVLRVGTDTVGERSGLDSWQLRRLPRPPRIVRLDAIVVTHNWRRCGAVTNSAVRAASIAEERTLRTSQRHDEGVQLGLFYTGLLAAYSESSSTSSPTYL